jgi:capsular polysaccharide biosynthesis protein
MIDLSWNIDSEDREAEITGSPRPLLGTWHYLRTALSRERRTWVGLGALGALLGVAVLVLLPPSSKATVTLLMAHPGSMDGPSAMGTDVSLLNTREVADRTVRELRIPVSAEEFQRTVTGEPVTTEILVVTVAAPDDAAALARARVLAQQYLAFRATQLRSLSGGLIQGYQKRITGLQEQATMVTRQYDAVIKKSGDPTKGGDLITRRSSLDAQINDLQQSIEEASLSTEAAISSTHVVDQPQLVRHSAKKRAVLAVVSGLIAGLALGMGVVAFRALTSDRVRRRHDVALALDAPVRYSVTSLGPGQGVLTAALPWRRRRRGWRHHDLEVLVHGLAGAVLVPGAGAGGGRQGPMPTGDGRGLGQGLALAAVGNARVAASVLAALGNHMKELGLTVFLLDLSASGAMAARDARSGGSLEVFRPGGVPGLARGPRWGEAVSPVPLRAADGWHDRWAAADVVLVLAEVNPGIDAENLATWVPQVVPLVTAGSSTPELLETTAELVRAARLDLPFALMVGSDDTDESIGLTPGSESGRAEPDAQRAVSVTGR